jgi:hypothetical protein
LKDGFGILWHGTKDVYRGMFKEDKKEGFGNEYFELEDQYYDGEFQNNMRHGHGKMMNSKLEL